MDQKFSGPTPLTVHPPTQRRSNSFSGERLRAFSSTFCDICHPIIPISLSPRREQHPPSPPQTPLTITTPQQDDKLCIFCELSHDVPAISSAVYPIMKSRQRLRASLHSTLHISVHLLKYCTVLRCLCCLLFH